MLKFWIWPWASSLRTLQTESTTCIQKLIREEVGDCFEGAVFSELRRRLRTIAALEESDSVCKFKGLKHMIPCVNARTHHTPCRGKAYRVIQAL